MIDDLIDRLLEREGGYVNHPADRGGPTNYGITQETLSRWRGKPVTAFQVQTMQKAEARQIYKDQYFDRPGFGAIADPELQEFVFDYAVNSGPAAAAKGLQTALKGMGLYTGGIDGGFGPQSQAAVRACRNVPELYYRTKCERYELFLRFIARDPGQSVFATGWANRMDELERRP